MNWLVKTRIILYYLNKGISNWELNVKEKGRKINEGINERAVNGLQGEGAQSPLPAGGRPSPAE